MGSELGVKTVCAGLKGKYEAAELADRRYKFSNKKNSLQSGFIQPFIY
jgi:hypothetical protein